MDDTALARRSILGFGEMIAALGRGGGGVVRRPDALGARIDAVRGNLWFDAAVVPPDATPPADEPGLPGCLWTVADAAPGRVERPDIAMPCLGVELDDPALRRDGGAADVMTPSLAVLGDLNERAYDDVGVFGALVCGLRDDRVRTYGLCDGGVFVCVALTLTVGDDLGIHFVATEGSHRRRGLASGLVVAVLSAAREAGLRSATLQASAEGLPVWERLGFRRVATLRGYTRSAS